MMGSQALEFGRIAQEYQKLSYVNFWFLYNPVSDQYSRSPKERVMAFYDGYLKNKVLTV